MSKLILSALLLISVISCSSAPTTRSAETERKDYSVQADNRLNDFSKRADTMRPETASQLRAQIADARVELNNLKAARVENWETYRTEVDNRLVRIQNSYQSNGTR